MKFNYNLIIIGINKLGLMVADYALKLGARVAIIDDRDDFYDNSLLYQLNSDNIFNISKVIEQENKAIKNRLNDLRLLGLDIYNEDFSINYNQKYIKISTQNNELISPVSIITISPKLFPDFLQESPNSKETRGNRETQINHLPIEIDSNILIKGSNLEAIYLTQTLLSCNKSITLITKNKQLLPQEDEDISWNLQLILEAEGVKLFNHYPLNKTTNNNNQLIIETENNNWKIPKYLENNLSIKWKNNQILVNQKLQTNNSKIYACGEILGGYNLDTINEYEAKIAVNNSLFFPFKTVDYSQVGYSLNLHPPLYRIGYTEKQISELDNNAFYVIKLFIHFNNYQHSNFIKLIISNNDYILGFHGLGKNLQELFNIVCYMDKNSLKLNYLFICNFSQSYSYQIINQIKEKWLQKKKRPNKIIINIRETFLLWKRI